MSTEAPELKAVRIVDMAKMRERAKEVEKAAREADHQATIAKEAAEGIHAAVEEIGEADDWKARFEELVVAVQDHERHTGIHENARQADSVLYKVCKRMLEGIGEDLDPEVRRS